MIADQPPLPPPTVTEARAAADDALWRFSQDVGGRLRIHLCPIRGRSSRVCDARVDKMRFRVVVTSLPDDYVMVRTAVK